MTTSSLHLELLLGARDEAPSTARPSDGQTVVGVMDAFGARRPLGAPLSYDERVGATIMVVGLLLIVVAALLT